MRLIFSFLVAAFWLVPAIAQEQETAPTTAETNEQAAPILLSVEEIVGVLREVKDPASFTSLAEGFAIPDAQLSLFVDHYIQIFADDAIAADFATTFAAEQGQFEVTSRDELIEIVRTLGFGWAHETALLGVPRLPALDQRAVIEANLAMIEGMAPDVCAASTRGALDPVETVQAEIAYLSTQELSDVEAHLTRSRRALIAEIADDPPFVPLSQAELGKASQAYQEAVIAGIDAHPLKPLVLEAVENFDLAPDEAICELTKISLKAALSIEGETGDLVRRLMMSG